MNESPKVPAKVVRWDVAGTAPELSMNDLHAEALDLNYLHDKAQAAAASQTVDGPCKCCVTMNDPGPDACGTCDGPLAADGFCGNCWKDSVGQYTPTGWVTTLDGRRVGYRNGFAVCEYDVTGIEVREDGILSGRWLDLKALHEAGAAVIGSDGELRWA